MATPTTGLGRQAVPVSLTPAGKTIQVRPDPAIFSKKDQELEWVCTTGQPFDIDFGTDSPFAKSKFTNADPKSGPAMVPHGPKRYKYTVTIPGCDPLDPDVIVNP